MKGTTGSRGKFLLAAEIYKFGVSEVSVTTWYPTTNGVKKNAIPTYFVCP